MNIKTALTPILLSSILGSGLVFAGQENSTVDTYSGYKLTLYSEASFYGKSISINQNTADLSAYNFNDIASSLKFEGSGWIAWLYEDVNYGGTMTMYSGNSQSEYLNSMNDRISSVRFEKI
ncbi:beta/gamma crystallin-related protein [Vibrio splendidus]|uniref:beta/gamma crystallin-related protein n=1 Tax=Vibrio splendidus TaxID=29497 RepID=UPI0024682B4F|nr:beta/gamma crystallin-related protein [Vibrio splendidus]MDH5918891.1 beta/gamma crystallin family protein [Vibrio splendidus]